MKIIRAKSKINFCLKSVSISVVLAGCASRPFGSYDPLAEFWQPYGGRTQTWPTSIECFTTKTDGVLFYHAPPDTPYIMLGRYGHENLDPEELATGAKFHGADAVLLLEKDVQITKTEHGMTFFGAGWAVSTPDKTKQETEPKTMAYLIKMPASPTSSTITK